ncbi:MAG: hypothetical protein AAGI11_15230 [Pseudomonadota bacterium]
MMEAFLALALRVVGETPDREWMILKPAEIHVSRDTTRCSGVSWGCATWEKDGRCTVRIPDYASDDLRIHEGVHCMGYIHPRGKQRATHPRNMMARHDANVSGPIITEREILELVKQRESLL